MMHWSDRVEQIFLSKSSDLRELARIAGFDPQYFYAHQSLAGCDLRGQDLRGMNLIGTDLELAIIDDTTKIDPEFDPRSIHSSDKDLTFRIPASINTMVISYNIEKKIKNYENGYRRLISLTFSCIMNGHFDFYNQIIYTNRHLYEMVSGSTKRADISIRLPDYFVEALDYYTKRQGLKSLDVKRALLIGLLRNRIKPLSKKDYSQLSPNAFYPPRLIRVEGSLAGR